MGKRPLSKKEQEDRRKREEETAAAHVRINFPITIYVVLLKISTRIHVGFQGVCRDFSGDAIHGIKDVDQGRNLRCRLEA